MSLVPEKAPKDPNRPRAAEEDRTLPLGALSASLRKLFQETPRKEWYQIKAVRATHYETTELALIANALEYLLKVTPERLLRRVTDGQVEERSFYAAYREIRDQIRVLKEKCVALGTLSGVEVKAWSDGRGRRRRVRQGPPVPLPDKDRIAS